MAPFLTFAFWVAFPVNKIHSRKCVWFGDSRTTLSQDTYAYFSAFYPLSCISQSIGLSSLCLKIKFVLSMAFPTCRGCYSQQYQGLLPIVCMSASLPSKTYLYVCIKHLCLIFLYSKVLPLLLIKSIYRCFCIMLVQVVIFVTLKNVEGLCMVVGHKWPTLELGWFTGI